MNIRQMNVYIAGPFFKPEQIKLIEDIESALIAFGVKFYSPRSEGTIINMAPDEKSERMNYIYNSNISHMDESNFMIAVIDDFDTGTVWEMGYFHRSKNGNLVTITNQDHGLNIMLRNSVNAHLKGLDDFISMLRLIEYNQNTKIAFSMFPCSTNKIT